MFRVGWKWFGMKTVIGWNRFWTKMSLDETIFGWKYHWMNPFLYESVIGWTHFWMKVSWMKLSSVLDEMVLDESVSGWKCLWMKVFLDESGFGWVFFFCNLDESVPNQCALKQCRNDLNMTQKKRSESQQNLDQWWAFLQRCLHTYYPRLQ